MKMHTPFIESPTQPSGVSLSQMSPANNTIPSVTSQTSIQRHSTLQSQNFVAPAGSRVPGTDGNMLVAGPKIFQKNVPVPQVKTTPSANLPVGRTPFVMALSQKKTFNLSTPTSSNAPIARVTSPQIDSSQSNEGNAVIHHVKSTENNFIHSSLPNTSVICSQGGTLPSTSPAFSNMDVSNLNNVMLRSMPSPPPYSVAISRVWDTSVNSNALLDLTPSIMDLKPDDLEDLLPTLELTQSPLPDLPDDFLSVNSNNISSTEEMKMSSPVEKRKLLINPLTGELELQPSDESDQEEPQDVFTGLRSPAVLSDDDTCSMSRFDPSTDQSDNETRAEKNSKLKNSCKDRGQDSPSVKQEKIKLRLKLEKSEPVNPAYKVRILLIFLYETNVFFFF